MSGRHHVYLVPGFFGFANLGEVVYFGHVREWLGRELSQGSVSGQVVVVRSHPTASLQTRVRDLVQTIADTAQSPSDDGPIHIIGHSSGGLDARLFLTPAAAQAGGELQERLAQRVKSLVTLSTPHQGTPLAEFFEGVFGPRLLQVLSLVTVYVLRFGRVPLPILFKVGATLSRASRLGPQQTLIDQIFSGLLADFSSERQAALTQFFEEMRSDQSLIPELTPSAMRTFNAQTPDRSSVRYASVVTQARRPSLRSRLGVGIDPYAHLTHSLYALFYRRTQRVQVDQIPAPSPAHAKALARAFGRLPRFRANDGIVPTLSQVWGEVLLGVWADHLDTLGHFDQPSLSPPHVDWFLSGSGFRRSDFERLWSAVARHLFL
ncbi:MAG: esterase/lipase family protein [Myxococcaceae bacterium]